MKVILSIIIVLFLGLAVFGQIATEKKVIRWQQGAENSESTTSYGQLTKTIHSNGISISAVLIKDKGWPLHAYLEIKNGSGKFISFDPKNCTLNIQTPKQQILTAKDPDKLADSFRKRSRLEDAAEQPSSPAQSTVLVRNADGTNSAVNVSQPKIDTRVSRDTARREDQSFPPDIIAQNIRASSLRAKTIFEQSTVVGDIWFDDKKFNQTVLMIEIGDVVYQFPFEKDNDSIK